MGLRDAKAFRFELLGELKVALETAKADFEDAMKGVQRAAGIDTKAGDDAFDRGILAWVRAREHRARVEAIGQAIQSVQTTRIDD